MNRQEIIELVRSLGGHADLRSCKDLPGKKILGVFSANFMRSLSVNSIRSPAITTTDHFVFLLEDPEGWTICYKAARTRPLSAKELETLITTWIKTEDYSLFAGYEEA